LGSTRGNLVDIGTSSPGATLDVNGNVGVGVPPNGTWGTAAIGLGKSGASNPTYPFIASTLSQDIWFGSNARWDGTNWKYQFSSAITAFAVETGYNSFAVNRAVAGAGGNNITWLPALKINDSGNVGIGTTSPSELLSVNGNLLLGNGGASGGAEMLRIWNDNGVERIHASNNPSALAFGMGGHTSAFEAMRIDGSRRLLVGTTSYAGNGRLVAAGNTGGNAGTLDICSTASRPTTANTDIGYLRWYVAENSSSNAHYASITASSDGDSSSGSDIPGRLVFSTTPDGSSSPTERMRITQKGGFVFAQGASGNFFSTPAVDTTKIESDSNLGHTILFNSSFAAGDRDALVWFYNSTRVGSIQQNTTAVKYNTSSDYRLKENVVPIADGIVRLQQLKPSRFNFKIDSAKTVDGFIAHEVQAIVPEAISGNKDEVDADGNPKYQGIDQSKLVPLLTAALQEAIGEIESLKARVAALEAA